VEAWFAICFSRVSINFRRRSIRPSASFSAVDAPTPPESTSPSSFIAAASFPPEEITRAYKSLACFQRAWTPPFECIASYF
jgi:hypothetical protein